MKEKKFNCYKCKYRRDVPGSAHSSCHHLDVPKGSQNPMAQLVAMFASVGRESPFTFVSKKLEIKGNPHGIRNGWFIWPINFDPVWLENCNGFTPKEEKDAKSRD